jgi:hypothetical protein
MALRLSLMVVKLCRLDIAVMSLPFEILVSCNHAIYLRNRYLMVTMLRPFDLLQQGPPRVLHRRINIFS